jgi:hypothetical protein
VSVILSWSRKGRNLWNVCMNDMNAIHNEEFAYGMQKIMRIMRSARR